MIVQLLTEQHLQCLSLKRGCRGLSKSTHVKMPHCWKSHALAHNYVFLDRLGFVFIEEFLYQLEEVPRKYLYSNNLSTFT